MVFKCHTIEINGKKYIHTIEAAAKKDKEEVNVFYVKEPVTGVLADNFGNYKYYIENNKIIKESIVLSREQKVTEVYSKRQGEYTKTDSLYFEAIFDKDDKKLEKWHKAVKEIKRKYPLPKDNPDKEKING